MGENIPIFPHFPRVWRCRSSTGSVSAPGLVKRCANWEQHTKKVLGTFWYDQKTSILDIVPILWVQLFLVIKCVVISKQAKKDLRKVPSHIADKLQVWIESVELIGLEEVRKRPGFHDEPLKGSRQGQRSIRLSKAYRAIYTLERGVIECAEIKEVNKHEY